MRTQRARWRNKRHGKKGKTEARTSSYSFFSLRGMSAPRLSFFLWHKKAFALEPSAFV
eukprot:COSAG02_NODE_553_length_20425_cov_17.986372_10_plen_58_part_00